MLQPKPFIEYVNIGMQKVWPVPEWQSEFDYKSPPRKFGSPRGGGRIHAGCDLYAPLGSEVLAITNGHVLAAGPFYLGSHAILIDHGPLGIVRYGEVAPDDHVEMGDQVKAGQIIGKIGRLVGIHVHPMLHLEWYDAKARSLSIAKFTCKDRPLYFRSEYLKDSTDLLDSLLCFRKGQICSAN